MKSVKIKFLIAVLLVVFSATFFAVSINTTNAQQKEDDSIFDKVTSNPITNIKTGINEVKNLTVGKVTEDLTSAFLLPFTFMGFLLKMFVSVLFAISAYMFGVVLNLNFNILQPTSVTYVFISTGWTIVRDVANLGFVLFIILIALATIVRYQDYEAKKLLPRLIGAAILVNFSLAIPTVFINFSNIVSYYFLSFEKTESCNSIRVISGTDDNLAARLCDLTVHMGSVLQPQKYVIDPKFTDDEIASIMGSADSGIIKAVLSTVSQYLGAMFLAAGVFVMTCYAILFVIRFIAFHFLLVLAPITWLFWVIPSTQGMFQKWWHKFMQYTFFAPAALFFLYLVIYTGKGINAITAGADPAPYLSFTQYRAEMLPTLVRTGVITFVMFGFLIGGLLAAQSLSVHGASGMVSLAKNTGKKAKQWAQKQTKEGGRAAVASKRGQEFANRLSRNKLTAPIGNYLAGVGWRKKQDVEKAQDKKMKDITHDGMRMPETKKGLIMPKAIAAYNRMVQDKGKPLEDEVQKKKKAFELSGEEYKDADTLKDKKEKQYEEIKKDLQDSIFMLEAEQDRTTDPVKKEELAEKITSQKARLNQAEDSLEKAKDKSDTAKFNKDEAQKAYTKALSDLEEFERNALSGFSARERQMWSDAKFDLSKTQFGGSAQIRDRQVPELSTKGIEKEITRLGDIMKDSQRKAGNPLLSEGERLAEKHRYNEAERESNGLKEAHNTLIVARNEEKTAMEELENLESKHGGADRVPEVDRKRVWGRIQTANKNLTEAKQNISLLHTPAFIKKEKGEEKTPKKKISIGGTAPEAGGGDEVAEDEEE